MLQRIGLNLLLGRYFDCITSPLVNDMYFNITSAKEKVVTFEVVTILHAAKDCTR